MIGLIYKLNFGEKCYIGSTINLPHRISRHKYSKNIGFQNKLYDYWRTHGDPEVEILKHCEHDLRLNEQLEMDKIDNDKLLNCYRAYISKEEYKQIYKTQFLCECGCSVRRDVIARHRASQKHLKKMLSIYNEQN